MKYNKRYRLMISLVVLLFVLLMGRLYYVTVIAKEDIYAKAQNQISKEIILPARRGDILDRNGAVLASTTEAYRLDADLVTFRKLLSSSGKTAESYAELIAKALGSDPAAVLTKLTSDHNSSIIQRKIEKETIDRVRTLIEEEDINFLLIGYDNIRYYPNGSYLSHVLGSVNVDGSGVMGLEYYYNETLKGISGLKIAEMDKKNRELPYAPVVETKAVNGNNLILSIDERIQYFIENLAEKAMADYEAKSVSILVSDPKTGGILGMVNLPDFDPNNPWQDRTQEEFDQLTRNRAVNDAYEPGSTFKIVTFSAALEEGLVDEHDHFFCPGYIYVDGVRINCIKRDGHKDQTLGEVLKNSCNVGTILIAQKLGKETFNAYVKQYMFGQKTGIDLPGESTGIVFKTENMKNVDLATASIGQANTVTPLQMMNAMNTIASGGVMNHLHLVDESVLRDKDEVVTQENLGMKDGTRIISESTAARMLEMMYQAIGANERSNAYIADIPVFGKTGTAQKIVKLEDGTMGYSDEEFISSFLGGAPYTDPKVTVLVVVDSPKGVVFGSVVAAPIFKEIILEVDQYLNLE